jgi:hypothetical protein
MKYQKENPANDSAISMDLESHKAEFKVESIYLTVYRIPIAITPGSIMKRDPMKIHFILSLTIIRCIKIILPNNRKVKRIFLLLET